MSIRSDQEPDIRCHEGRAGPVINPFVRRYREAVTENFIHAVVEGDVVVAVFVMIIEVRPSVDYSPQTIRAPRPNVCVLGIVST
jgi:hypothetical protein